MNFFLPVLAWGGGRGSLPPGAHVGGRSRRALTSTQPQTGPELGTVPMEAAQLRQMEPTSLSLPSSSRHQPTFLITASPVDSPGCQHSPPQFQCCESRTQQGGGQSKARITGNWLGQSLSLMHLVLGSLLPAAPVPMNASHYQPVFINFFS